MITANEAKILTEFSKEMRYNVSKLKTLELCKEIEAQISEEAKKGNNEIRVSYNSSIIHSSFTTSDLRQIVKNYFEPYGYSVTVPSIIRICW